MTPEEQNLENERLQIDSDANDDRNKKFAIFMIEMLQSGRMYFCNRSHSYGELPSEEVDVVIEFAGGPESVGNDNDRCFSWKKLINIVEEQGLLK